MRFLLLLLFQVSLFAIDFDYVFIGTSPFSLFEALYQSQSGKKVLILEEHQTCGGAWKTIEICGISHADLGCHQIGHDMQLKSFLEEYIGCKIVSLDNPLLPFDPAKSPNGYYFSKGCFELIDHIMELIGRTDIELRIGHKVESISINPSEKEAFIYTKDQIFTAKKVIVTPMSSLLLPQSQNPQAYGKTKYYHLYMLIQDPTSPRFSYKAGIMSGISRAMNLTHFTSLAGTGRQLIVVQTHTEQGLKEAQTYIDNLKKQNLIDKSAFLLKEEPYIYESGSFHRGLIAQIGAEEIIEVLQTGHFQTLANYIAKWKQVLKPY